MAAPAAVPSARSVTARAAARAATTVDRWSADGGTADGVSALVGGALGSRSGTLSNSARPQAGPASSGRGAVLHEPRALSPQRNEPRDDYDDEDGADDIEHAAIKPHHGTRGGASRAARGARVVALRRHCRPPSAGSSRDPADGQRRRSGPRCRRAGPHVVRQPDPVVHERRLAAALHQQGGASLAWSAVGIWM